MLLTLVALALALMFVPRRWLGPLVSVMQVLHPLQRTAEDAADSLARAVQGEPPAVAAGEHAEVLREKTALEHRLAALTLHAAKLEDEVRVLTATRVWEVDGKRIGARGQLIPARMLGRDLLPWRDSRALDAGSLKGVASGAAVVSNLLTLDRGQNDGLSDGMAVLLAETLVGTVEQVGVGTSRVRLLSDVNVQMKVRIGRYRDGTFTPLDRYFWLAGRGRGLMQVRDVDRRDVDAGHLAVGDTVLADPATARLPVPMAIGKVKTIEPDRDKPLLAVLTVQSAVDAETLDRVYVYDPAPPPSP
ncbi:MAG: rod shape-determining protein MreC [Planctomycetes bacterium]|nr:rod shape-determining protein MreC [Planctomycetota bacterium]